MPRFVLIVIVAFVVSCSEGKDDGKTKFSGTTRTNGFGKIEAKMCDEDVLARPDDWEDHKACADQGRVYMRYYDESRPVRCLEFPRAKSYGCSISSFIKTVRKLEERDLEVNRQRFIDAGSPEMMEKYAAGTKEYTESVLRNVDKLQDDFILNCFELERNMEGFGKVAVVAFEAYFPNKRTFDEGRGCSLYSDFTTFLVCYEALVEAEDQMALKEEEEIVKEGLGSGPAGDKTRDEFLRCMRGPKP